MDVKFHSSFKALLFNYRIIYRSQRLEIHCKFFTNKQENEVFRSPACFKYECLKKKKTQKNLKKLGDTKN